MTLRIYDPDQVSLIFAGVEITGWADGSFVKVEHTTPRRASVAGTDGDVTRSRSKDKRGMITFRLMQTSPSNDILSAISIADDLAPNGAGVAPVLVRDGQGRANYAGAQAWIVDQPDAEFDRGAKEREWKIEVAELDDFTGGN